MPTFKERLDAIVGSEEAAGDPLTYAFRKKMVYEVARIALEEARNVREFEWGDMIDHISTLIKDLSK